MRLCVVASEPTNRGRLKWQHVRIETVAVPIFALLTPGLSVIASSACRAVPHGTKFPLVNRMMASAALGIAFGPAGLLGALFGPDDIFS